MRAHSRICSAAEPRPSLFIRPRLISTLQSSVFLTLVTCPFYRIPTRQPIRRMAEEKKQSVADVEKDSASVHDYAYAQRDWHYSHKWTRKLLQWGLETRGTFL